MRLFGVLIILAGWAIAVSGLFLSSSNSIRILFCLGGISVSLFGIFGVINQYYLARANWKK